MMILEQFHFLRPAWLLALIPLVILLWLMLNKKLGSRSWEAVCDENLLPYILIGSPGRLRRIAVVLTGIAGLLSILALAGPVWEKLPQPVFSNRSALVIALDLSRSMDANDISPSRLVRARYKIADLLNLRQEGQTALIVYAGDSYTVTPLTDDVATIAAQLNALSTAIMPVQGGRADTAVATAVELLKQAGAGYGDILLIGDELDYARLEEPLTAARDRGYRVSVMGIGTERGVPVPLADGSFLKDSNGRIVVPVLDEKSMRRVAESGSGLYVRMTRDDTDVQLLQEFFSGFRIDGEVATTELKTDVWREQGPWLIIVLLPLVAIIFRRGYLVVLFICLMPLPETAQALDWKNLWLRRDQQAEALFNQGEYEAAAELFENPAWKGSALYRTEDYQAAAEALEQARDLENIYNKGNALARLGRYEEALAMYEKVLEQNPDHEDAGFNKALLERELEQQQQQQQQPGSDQEQQHGNDQAEQDNSQQQAGDQQQSGNGQQDESASEQQAGARDQQQQAEQDPQQDAAGRQHDPQQQEHGEDPWSEQQQMAGSDELTPDEQQQATEQWLRRIPDDPGGLLRRKFRYQYQQRADEPAPGSKTW
jgi:Ca-activated chloride channel family protein